MDCTQDITRWRKGLLITRETDYAIRALRALADGRKKTLSTICEEEAVPQQFGYKILKKLAGAGYVQIKRGKEGGYTISDNFLGKSLYDLTRVMDNPTDVSPCVMPGYICEAHREKGEVCNVNLRLSALQMSIDSELRAVNLCELVAEPHA
jgi:Rrf2 family protein